MTVGISLSDEIVTVREIETMNEIVPRRERDPGKGNTSAMTANATITAGSARTQLMAYEM
jgi:hypothetical protein